MKVLVRLLISTLLLMALLFPGQDLWNFPLINKSFDLFHFPSFFLLSYLLSACVTIKRLAVSLIIIAALIECIQPFIGRSADIVDFLLGIWGVASWYLYQSHIRISQYMANTSMVLFIITALLILYPQANGLRYQNQVGNFDLRESSSGWRNIDDSYNQPVELLQLGGKKQWVLKGRVLDYPWSGASYDWALPYSYDNSLTLSFNFFSEKSGFELDIKLTAIGGDSFIVSKNIDQVGWNNIQIPLTKHSLLNSDYIKSLSIYYESDAGLDWYFLDKVMIQ